MQQMAVVWIQPHPTSIFIRSDFPATQGARVPMTSTAQESSQDLRFPIGKFQRPAELDAKGRADAIESIARTPARLRDAVNGLTSEQIETPYRPGGWTVRQVVHHVPDSHLNAYIRFKLALTEDVTPRTTSCLCWPTSKLQANLRLPPITRARLRGLHNA